MWAAPVGQNAVGVPCLLPRGPNKQDGVAFLKDPRPKKYSRGRMDRSGPVRTGPERSGLVRIGPVRNGPVRNRPNRAGPVWTRPVRTSLDWFGPARNGPDPPGPVRGNLTEGGPRPGSPEARDRGSGHGPWGAGLGPL